ncbi:MAG: DUF3347 domain-containing protein [Chitinophagales bacterium]|nr:DUF3347 domain-containing protein [Chitinophagales bacterium]
MKLKTQDSTGSSIYISLKKILLITIILASVFVQQSIAQDTTSQSQFSQLLRSYYDIKDALVSGNAGSASSNAEQFVKTANGISYRNFVEGNRDALLKDAGKISDTKDLTHQREHFANLSANMFALAKSVKLTSEPVYQVYCPMKKAVWLSKESAIKNPYFGSAMLTCGSIKDTLK